MASLSYWLLKTEPHAWSWSQQCAAQKPTPWDGVHNMQALGFLKKMQVGDLGFFYHTGSERAMMGVIEIVQTFELDPSDPPSGWIYGVSKYSLNQPVTLRTIKAHPHWSSLHLVKQPRLSVMPITSEDWAWIHHVSETPLS